MTVTKEAVIGFIKATIAPCKTDNPAIPAGTWFLNCMLEPNGNTGCAGSLEVFPSNIFEF